MYSLFFEPATITALFVKICTGNLEQMSTTTGGPRTRDRPVLENADVEVVVSAYGAHMHSSDHAQHLLTFLTAVLEQRKTNARAGKRFSLF